MIDAKVIGQRLLQLRNNLNKTRKDVAKACGISVSALTMYEIGERIPRDEIKIRLSNYYKKSITSIFFK
ncbi:helix-turn-helix transcriptional regulator [Megamonas funiformis]|uniref:helix-turn-helix transcriptional regulator n=1 Tax=Megamonas funiformis TaxID=437897 RepID=UPI0039F4BC34